MGRYSPRRIREHFQLGDNATTTTEKGRALEELIRYVFESVPGIPVTRRDEQNVFLTEEIDIAFWNDKSADGFSFLPNIILVECKNWSRPVGSEEVSYFIDKIRHRGLDLGILVAVNGITGSSEEITAAHYQVAFALHDGIRIIVITREEIEDLSDTEELIRLLKLKLCDLALKGTTLV